MLKHYAKKIRNFGKPKNTDSNAIVPEEFRLSFPNRVAWLNLGGTDSYLSYLCDVHGSDKGTNNIENKKHPWPSHNYCEIYEALFEHCRFSFEYVFECGIGSTDTSFACNMSEGGRPGASLRVWRDYFPNAKVFGADIDRKTLFQESRIVTGYIDQTDAKSVQSYFIEFGQPLFDLMIDDGLHQFDAARILFENSIKHLKSTGMYIIEDLSTHDLSKLRDYFVGLPYRISFVLLERANLPSNGNTLVIIRKLSHISN